MLNEIRVFRLPSKNFRISMLLDCPFSPFRMRFCFWRIVYPSPPWVIYSPTATIYFRSWPRLISSLSTSVGFPSGPTFLVSSRSHIFSIRLPGSLDDRHSTRNPEMAGYRLVNHESTRLVKKPMLAYPSWTGHLERPDSIAIHRASPSISTTTMGSGYGIICMRSPRVIGPGSVGST